MKKNNPSFSKRKLLKTFVRQHDQQDCGVACLLSLLRYYGGDATLERLRELSGTAKEGTSLLGLYQAAVASGLSAEGCEADIEALIGHGKPVILHVCIDEKAEHYVICYAYVDGKFIIGDPAAGITEWTTNELKERWPSQACLTVAPAAHFERKDDIKKFKKEWIVKLIKDDIGILTISMIIGLVMAALGMVMAVFSQKLIDNILPSNDYTKLITGLSIAAILLLLNIGLQVIRQRLLLRQSKDFNNRIVGNFYARLLFLPKAFFDYRKVGDMTARLNDTRRIQTVISNLLGDLIISVLTVVLSFVFIFLYSWQLALPILCSLPLFFAVIYSHNKRIIHKQREVMSAYAQSESNFINTIQGVSAIKNFNRQDVFSELNRHIYGVFQNKIYSLGSVNIALMWKSGLVAVGISMLVLTIGSTFVFNQVLSLGRLMAVLSISASLLPSISAIAMAAIPFNEAKVAFDRMFEFLGLKTEEELSNTVIHEHLQAFQSLNINNVSFRFPGRPQLLQNITMDIRKGEFVSIAGESGCGKSTFCQILSKFYPYENGDIILNDTLSIKSIGTEQWRSIIGVVPQETFIFNGTVLSNICLDNTIEEMQKAADFCASYGFDQFISELPQSYATIVGEEGINLSGGQKQLIALARAVYRKPSLLILDEATASMDKKMEQFALNLLSTLKSETAILFVSHRLHILKNISDRIYLFEKGMIHSFGTHEELMRTNNFYSEYWEGLRNE